MIFYRVNPESNEVSFNNGWKLISNELHTQKEVDKMSFNKKQIKIHFKKIALSKFKTYWCFGARFQNKFEL